MFDRVLNTLLVVVATEHEENNDLRRNKKQLRKSNTRTRCEIFSKLTIKTPERRQ